MTQKKRMEIVADYVNGMLDREFKQKHKISGGTLKGILEMAGVPRRGNRSTQPTEREADELRKFAASLMRKK